MRLLADAEAGEDGIKEVVGVGLADEPADCLRRSANVVCRKQKVIFSKCAHSTGDLLTRLQQHLHLLERDVRLSCVLVLFGNSFPALFPDDPSLNYHNLSELCQNGGDAMTIFPRIQFMDPEEATAAREALLRYCELDTWAMVKVWEKLKEVAK